MPKSPNQKQKLLVLRELLLRHSEEEHPISIKQMIDDNRYCGDVLIQLSATRSAIQSIERIVLQNHLETCVVEEIRNGNDAIIDEAMDLIRRVSR